MQFLCKPSLSFVMVSILGLRQAIPIMTPIIYCTGYAECHLRLTRPQSSLIIGIRRGRLERAL